MHRLPVLRDPEVRLAKVGDESVALVRHRHMKNDFPRVGPENQLAGLDVGADILSHQASRRQGRRQQARNSKESHISVVHQLRSSRDRDQREGA